MAQWFEVKVRFDKMQENGSVKKVNEPYLVDALSFSEAEARVSEEVTGEFSIHAEKKTKISEIFFNEGDKYHLVKVAFITLDEKTGAEKRTFTYILVQANDFDSALANFKEGMKGTMADWEIASVAETQIMDVFKAKL